MDINLDLIPQYPCAIVFKSGEEFGEATTGRYLEEILTDLSNAHKIQKLLQDETSEVNYNKDLGVPDIPYSMLVNITPCSHDLCNNPVDKATIKDTDINVAVKYVKELQEYQTEVKHLR